MWNTLHVSNIDVGSFLIGSTASVTAFHHYLSTRSYPDFSMNSQRLVNESGRNVVRTHPYAHPLHMKIFKHLACVWHWYWISLDWVYSLNHCFLPSFVHQEKTDCSVTSQSLVNESGRNVVRTHPYSHPLHIKNVKHLACVWHWCGIILDWVYSLSHRNSPLFVHQELPRFLNEFPKIGQWERS
jgi:hypothetical protein